MSSPRSLDAAAHVHETVTQPVTQHAVENPLDPDDDYICVDTAHSRSLEMDCGFCKRLLTQEDGPHCVSCVRGTIYGVRLELARVLLEKEQLGKKVETITAEDEPHEHIDDELSILRTAWHSQVDTSELQQINDETADIERQTAIVKKEVELKKAKVKDLKENLDKRKANLVAAKKAQAKDRQQKLEKLMDEGAKLKAEHDVIHNRIMDAKAVLCREAASLLGLRHSKKKTKDGTIKDRYFIAGLPLPDLKDINSKCIDITRPELF